MYGRPQKSRLYASKFIEGKSVNSPRHTRKQEVTISRIRFHAPIKIVVRVLSSSPLHVYILKKIALIDHPFIELIETLAESV